jgi:hypothetical protein
MWAAGSKSILIPNGPGGFTDISERLRNAIITGNEVAAAKVAVPANTPAE